MLCPCRCYLLLFPSLSSLSLFYLMWRASAKRKKRAIKTSRTKKISFSLSTPQSEFTTFSLRLPSSSSSPLLRFRLPFFNSNMSSKACMLTKVCATAALSLPSDRKACIGPCKSLFTIPRDNSSKTFLSLLDNSPLILLKAFSNSCDRMRSLSISIV